MKPAGRAAARSLVKQWLADERGATAVEYGLILSLIFLVIVSSVTAFGNNTTTLINHVASVIGAAT